jgi:hypothetical protein
MSVAGLSGPMFLDSHNHATFVVSVADLFANVLGIWTAIYDALGIMDIPTLGSTPRAGWFGWIRQVNEDDAGPALVVTWNGSDRVGKVRLLVDHHVVRTTDWQAPKETSQVSRVRESYGLLGVDIKKLRHVRNQDKNGLS